MASAFLLLAFFCIVEAQLDGLPEVARLKAYMTEFRPCNDSADNKFIFHNASFWFVNRSTIEISCTVEVLVEIDHTAWGKIELTKCEGSGGNCETYPEIICDDLCKDLWKEGTPWNEILRNAENMNVTDCPIPPGTYRTTNAMMDVMKSTTDSAKMEAFKGELQIYFYFYLGEDQIGCQYLEGMIEDDDGSGKKKKKKKTKE